MVLPDLHFKCAALKAGSTRECLSLFNLHFPPSSNGFLFFLEIFYSCYCLEKLYDNNVSISSVTIDFLFYILFLKTWSHINTGWPGNLCTRIESHRSLRAKSGWLVYCVCVCRWLLLCSDCHLSMDMSPVVLTCLPSFAEISPEVAGVLFSICKEMQCVSTPVVILVLVLHFKCLNFHKKDEVNVM